MSTELRSRFLDRVDEIPTLPRVVQRVVGLCNDPMSAIRDFEEAFSADPALAARILRLVNSGYFSLPHRISSISRAVTFLGFNAVRAVALSVGAVDVFGRSRTSTLDTEAFWSHAVAVSEASRLLARRYRLGSVESAQTAGLLHDLAILVLHVHFPDDAKALAAEARGGDDPEAERAIFDTDHGELGALLLDRWGLPPDVVAAVRHHHGDDEALRGHPTALAVHVADHVVRRWTVGPTGPAPLPLLSAAEDLIQGSDLDSMEETVAEWVERAHALLG